jgi:hypothetical protein
MIRSLVLSTTCLATLITLGCESAVLVNTRPDANSPADTAQPAAYRDNDNASNSANAATTQPAQTVNTKHTNVQLQNDSR